MDAWIGLGANLGERRATLEAALDALRTLPRTRLIARSRLWASAPVDATGPDYLNAVARLDTLLDAHDLLAALQAIEARFGRERAYRNAPRTLDLDLLLAGDATIDTATPRPLVVPHPRLHERAFVLRPMADIDADVMVPGRGPVRQCLARVADQRCVPWP
ncbi:MAG: 2-amino-4-hydroxy-6-hydroxymethyldihydropteridine diphosphokinase [Burkholderiales bacterium]|nr:MAG: 2-amino-4-hydroxy-6-hydroxymethyldihydropteridine diphosphokinase [Burkholderiales bacterium]